MKTNTELVAYLEAIGALTSPNLIAGFEAIDRKHFVPREYEAEAYADHALPIGYGQTISQPFTVAFMLELLEPQSGERMLDVGAGSGWTTALLGYVAGKEGAVVGCELVLELVEQGKENLAPYLDLNACITHTPNGFHRLKKGVPFDRILVSAEASKIPEDLFSALVTGGTMVIPINGGIERIIKTDRNIFEKERYEGFAFVPLL